MLLEHENEIPPYVQAPSLKSAPAWLRRAAIFMVIGMIDIIHSREARGDGFRPAALVDGQLWCWQRVRGGGWVLVSVYRSDIAREILS